MSTFNKRIVVLLKKVLRCCRTVEHVQEHGGAGEGEGEGRLLLLVHPLVSHGSGEDAELEVAEVAAEVDLLHVRPQPLPAAELHVADRAVGHKAARAVLVT